MRLRALLDTPSLGLRLLGGEDELDRTVRGVMTTDLRDPSRYLSGGELVLTGLAWRRAPEDSERFVRILAAAGVAGLAAGEAELGSVPDDLVAACVRHRLPLFSVVEDVSFASITEHVVRQVSSERAGDLAAVVDRHRRLMTSGPTGGGPEVVLDLLGSDLDLRAWVLSPTGRQIAGSTLAGAGPELSAGTAARLAGEHLAAARSGRRGPHRVTIEAAGAPGGATFSLFPIRHDGRDLRQTLLSDWLLAVEADAGDWPEERLDLLHGVTQLIAVERDRRDAARTVRRRLAQEVLELVQTGAPPAEIAARLRVAAPVLLPGLGTAPHWQIVVARVEWEDGDVPGGPVAQSLLEEMLVDPGTFGPEPSDRIAVAHTGDEAVALVPLPVPDEPGDASAAGLHADELLSVVQEPLGRGLADDGRLTVGVSASVHSAEGLRGALEEARHARRVAAARPGRVCAAGHEELASHVLLLPFVPDDVRRAFTARLLDPLRDYDRRHRAELIPTLEAFLDCDGSWTRCATRLHLHVNTLRYRVGRIEQLTGRDLARLEDKLDFFLALRMS
ncbi:MULTISPECIES: PucR family transcriptional regulator ligand-binding domain-containing protein [Streptomyces]|uniref:PucR family transcriptional regulator ligand-binding domain-containing protein n=4 Tax=Streptomyces nigrescens TaxID=1920 RepID=A0A640TDI7_STRNI|nr:MULTISPECIES: PucR family transcriptional regulator ligand-binding domain-containing protein [Streptomyces]AWN30386.1 PucR family transcriptional regulator [Streptomyces sp. NEAU-S7GS2]MCX5447312.1 PucR family transcriptional regulator ligand-binding domain-containing protein [Streptomyces libani]MYT14516.1 PucR family transcriptional regulator [Streptomyces sp. SID4951]WAT95969.1 PucR family transcriptional regulator ligand-binding domain-containing protein [Streptomyces libani subsp. liban